MAPGSEEMRIRGRPVSLTLSTAEAKAEASPEAFSTAKPSKRSSRPTYSTE